MGKDGRKNCLVAGIKRTRTIPSTVSVLISGADGAIAREKRIKAARATY